jgi:hypothetical protein
MYSNQIVIAMCEDEKMFLLVQPRKHVLNPFSMGIK